MPERRPRVGVPAAVVATMLAIAVVYLRRQGRVWVCSQGDWARPVSLAVNSPHNSQHLFDPYTLSHLLHGILFYGLFWLFRARLEFRWRLVLAAAIEIGWEMMENSAFIIDRYRTATISLGYVGDSILNSLGDVLGFVAGFYVARRLGLRWSVVVFLAIELGLLWWIRDDLALNILMLLWPIDAVRRWQAGG